MDANGTRYHLLLGKPDWGRCFDASGKATLGFATGDNESAGFGWDSARSEITLFPRLFVFIGTPAETKPQLADRRGAGRDRFGNWYWIAPDRISVLVQSIGSGVTGHFWGPRDASRRDEVRGDFEPAAKPDLIPLELSGLAITDDHYLVVGAMKPAGYFVFDLFGGGPPLQFLWPETIGFAPFDMSSRPGGGVWILDREHRRIWELDRHLRVTPHPLSPPGGLDAPGVFQPSSATARLAVKREQAGVESLEIAETDAWPLADPDAVAIEPLSDGSVLILRSPAGGAFSKVSRYQSRQKVGQDVDLDGMRQHVEETRQSAFRLLGHDFAFTPDPEAQAGEPARGRLFVAADSGNQAFAFNLSVKDAQLLLEPLPAYFPMRSFGGKALVSAGVDIAYDFGDAWIPLVEQFRPRFAFEATLLTPMFDGREPGCVWHRLMLDGGLPPETEVKVWSRASDEAAELPLAPWRAEPKLYRRGDGSELPFAAKPANSRSGTQELLFQDARARYLQLKITLSGNGRTTPRLRTLRAYYPRFSYLREYLPAVYREDAESASFLDRFLANPEGFFTALEDKIASVQMLFDCRSAPAEALGWLAKWFGLALDAAWNEPKQRLFIQHAMEFFQFRGTIRGIQMALRLALEDEPGQEFFSGSMADRRCAERFRIVEKFRTRRTPAVTLGDPTEQTGPREIAPAARWLPNDGAAELHRRYRDFLAAQQPSVSPATTFPLAEPAVETDAGPWREFARATLGFIPSAMSDDLERWRDFLDNRYGNVASLNDEHGTSWGGFDEVPLPRDVPEEGALRDDWNDFVIESVELGSSRREALWQAFLARRYRRVEVLNTGYDTHWLTFAQVPVPRELPTKPAALQDWFQFEAVVLTLHQAAHKFIVLLPVALRDVNNVTQRQRNLGLARRLVELEKAAHTAFDVKFYWAMFRVGEARLGADTLVGLGSRAPELLTPLILDQSYLSQTYLVPTPPRNLPGRFRVGTDGA